MALFEGTSVSGRISPGEFMLKSEQEGAQYGHLFNQAYQSAADRKLKADQGAWPKPRNGQVPNGNGGNVDIGGSGGAWDSQFGQGIDIPG